jgi:methylenetetrahydrofolate dehydrogenase (NADP+)/methenyltetrahydrofolate cyclohydrolase
MTARIIDGNALSAEVRGQLATRAAALAAKGITPCLAVILVGEDPASAVYVRNKVAACEKAGMRSLRDVYAPDVDPAVVFARIAELNADPTVHGILVQLPLPRHFDSEAVLESIARRRMSTASTPKTSAPWCRAIRASFPAHPMA